MGKRRVMVVGLVAALLIEGTPSRIVTANGTETVADQLVSPVRSPRESWKRFATLLPAPSGDEFFIPPSPLPGKPGDAIWASKSIDPRADWAGIGKISLPTVNGRTPEVWKIMYHSLDRRGQPMAGVAWLVFDPQSAVGATTLVYMHGWLGAGDQCGVMRGPNKMSMAAAYLDNYLTKGWLLVVPDGPGMATPDANTSFISLNVAQSILDATYAGQLFSGASERTIIAGSSLGGMAALAVNGVAPTYTPDLDIRGIVSVVPVVTGPGSLGLHWVKATEWVSVLIAYANQLNAAFGNNYIPLRKFLTPIALRLAAQYETLCSTEMDSKIGLLRYSTATKKDLPNLDAGNLSKIGIIPTLIVQALSEQVVDTLDTYLYYSVACEQGQPTKIIELSGDHFLAYSSQSFRQLYSKWIDARVAGVVNSETCQPINPRIQRTVTYTGAHLADALRIPVPYRATVNLTTTGPCRVKKGNLFHPAFLSIKETAGPCKVTITIKKKKKVVSTHTVTFNVTE